MTSPRGNAIWYRFSVKKRDGSVVFVEKNYHGRPPALGAIVEIEHELQRVVGEVVGPPKPSVSSEHGHVGLVAIVELAEV